MIHFDAFQFWPVRSHCSLLESTWTKVVQEANRPHVKALRILLPLVPENPSNFRISFNRNDALKNNTSSQLVFLPQISKSGDS